MKPRKRRSQKHQKKLERLKRRGKIGAPDTIPGRGKNRAGRHQGAAKESQEDRHPSSDSEASRP